MSERTSEELLPTGCWFHGTLLSEDPAVCLQKRANMTIVFRTRREEDSEFHPLFDPIIRNAWKRLGMNHAQ